MKDDRRKQMKRVLAAGLGILLTVETGILQAVAEPRIPEDMSQEQYDRLQDNLLEWDEIDPLITYYSPVFAVQKESILEGTLAPIQNAVQAWQTEIDDLSWKENNLKDDLKQAVNPAEIQQLTIELYTVQGTRQAYQQVKSGLRKAEDQAETAVDRSFEANKPQLVNGMEQAFLGAKQLEQALAINQEQLALYQAAYQTQQRSVQLGLATEAQLRAAEYEAEQAQTQVQKTEAQLNQIRRSIGLMLGWSAESAEQISFGDLPSYDLNYLDSRNLETDIEWAYVHNKDRGNALRESAKNSYERNIKEDKIELTEDQIRIEMTRLYQTISEKRLKYDAAQAGLEAARLSRESAERKLALGMVGNAEYEGLKLQYIAKEAQANLAQMEYVQAVFAYEWAMRGIITIS